MSRCSCTSARRMKPACGTTGLRACTRRSQAQGIGPGRHRVARLMRYEGIVACTEKHFRWTATARAELPAPPDRLKRDFTADGAQSALGL